MVASLFARWIVDRFRGFATPNAQRATLIAIAPA
jgi:hypothetical protein